MNLPLDPARLPVPVRASLPVPALPSVAARLARSSRLMVAQYVNVMHHSIAYPDMRIASEDREMLLSC